MALNLSRSDVPFRYLRQQSVGVDQGILLVRLHDPAIGLRQGYRQNQADDAS